MTEVELPLVHVLAAMEREGLKLDAKRLAEVGAGFGERIDTLEKEIYELAGEEFTIGSPQQVGRILFEELGLTRKRRGKTGYSTDARVLAQISDEHPIVEKIESWRELTKLKNTYLDSLPDLIDPQTGRVHTTFNQAATTTGRLSSTNPNLQNIPIRTEIGRPVRACFVAEEGNQLLSADYSQVELRVLAHVADEDVLKEIFRAKEDVHAATAAEVFDIAREDVDVGQRSKAKMVNFGIVYGLTGFGLADRLNIPRKEGEEFVSRYLERFPAVRAFREQVVERAQEEGYVTTLMGRRRAIPELRSGNPNTRRLGERLAVNTVIQGTAADIIKVAMVRCRRALAETGGRHGSSCRSTTSSSSRARRRRWTARSSWCGARCAPPTSSTHRSRWTSASARTGSTPSSSAGQLDLVEGRAAVLELQLGLLDRRTGDQVRGRAVGACPVVVVAAGAAAGVRRAGSGVVAAMVVTGLFAVIPMVVTRLFSVPTVVVAGLFLAVASARRDVGGVLVLALDPGPVGDQATDRVAAEEGDRQFPGGRVEGRDRAGVLVAVDDAVVVAVAIARVVVGEELATVAQLVTVLVPTRLVDVERKVMSRLPAVRDAVVVAVLGGGDSRQRQHRERSSRHQRQAGTGSSCLGANHRFLLGW